MLADPGQGDSSVWNASRGAGEPRQTVLRQTSPAKAKNRLPLALCTNKSGIPFVASACEANLGFYQIVILNIA